MTDSFFSAADIFVVAFSTKRLESESLTTRLSEMGGIELWSGCWLVNLSLGSFTIRENFEWCHPSGGAVVLPLDATRLHLIIGSGLSQEARKLAEPFLRGWRRRQGLAGAELVATFFNGGEELFASTVDAARRAFETDAAPTTLCEMMLKYGSDKALGWHTYSILYAELFARLSRPVLDLLEIGIGTNNLDVQSSMGSDGIPGASLRAWRDYLPDARIYGADIDRRILFSDRHIATAFLDQTRVETFHKAWESLGLRMFDVIIDDGLHTLKAASTTLDSCIFCTRSTGVFVIEDVPAQGRDAYIDLAESRGLSGAFVALPSASNYFDNNLLIVAGAGSPN